MTHEVTHILLSVVLFGRYLSVNTLLEFQKRLAAVRISYRAFKCDISVGITSYSVSMRCLSAS